MNNKSKFNVLNETSIISTLCETAKKMYFHFSINCKLTYIVKTKVENRLKIVL